MENNFDLNIKEQLFFSNANINDAKIYLSLVENVLLRTIETCNNSLKVSYDNNIFLYYKGQLDLSNTLYNNIQNIKLIIEKEIEPEIKNRELLKYSEYCKIKKGILNSF